ncbi:MAG: holo-ACP synthase [Spirochaetales bacterium]|nr:holo-ACP synthase [Spirochaetales bacterium]
MILGVGLDVVHVERLRHWLGVSGLLDRFFHPDEIAAVRSRGESAALSLAARFAAKEAFGKAIGTGLRGIALRDIRVDNDEAGKPHIFLYGSALAAFARAGGRTVHLSLTHERDNAMALAVVEG